MTHDDHGHTHVPGHGEGPVDDGPLGFDERAATWDDDAKVARAALVADAIVAVTDPDPSTRVFEYGAGTGLVTEALGARVGPSVLADTSAGMREVMASKVADGRLPTARVTDLDLSAADVQLSDERFDLVITVLTLHHVGDVGPVLDRFHRMLDVGGRVCIVDLDAEDGSFHGDGFTGHHGFERDDLAAVLRSAGFDDVVVSDCGRLERGEGEYPMFVAVGTATGRGRDGGVPS